MYRRLLPRRLSLPRKQSFLPPFLVGIGIWIGFPTALAYQDIASLVSGVEGQNARWGAYAEKSVAGSLHRAEMPFADTTVASVISGAGMTASGIGAVAFRTKDGAPDETPDEERINRDEKRGRIVKIAPVSPPKAFSAGSVIEHRSSLLSPSSDTVVMAFAEPSIKGKEIQIATAFYARTERKPNPGIPAVLAALVNNEKADILATAYAPPEPDYAKASPFASLLKDETEGRFIPPLAEGDHNWAGQPLPPEAFSNQEQQCLAAGVYFEARGEAVKGQAAVAQVILNRVRNPAYPNSICGVVYQNEKWRNRCQFSFACDGIRDRVASKSHWKTAEDVAMAVTAGKIWMPEVGSSTHYHATYVSPRWARTMEKMKKIGQHIFYRTYGGGWN